MKKLFKNVFSFCSNKKSVDVENPTKPTTEKSEVNNTIGRENNLMPASKNVCERKGFAFQLTSPLELFPV